VPQGLLWRKLGERLPEVPNWGKIGGRGGRLLPSMASYRPGSLFSVQSARSMTQKTGLQDPVPAYNILRTAFRTGAIILSKTASHMTDEKPATGRLHTLRGDEARQDRLKAKLRENLKRRKLQERERGRPSSDSDQDCPDGEVGKTDA
jgi:hypothetical protein